MKIDRLSRCIPVALACLLAGFCMVPTARADDGYGAITGQFVLDGKVPKPKLLFKAGDPTVKDPTICAAKDRYDNSLVVDEKTKGIQHIFVYERRAEKIHPDLKESKQKEIKFDQKFCTFRPHTLLVRTDQTVRVISSDSCSHNTHTVPILNQGINFILRPNDKVGIEVTHRVPEILPIQVKCDIHNWMKAYWLILDHPYAAITDEHGRFKIEKLPTGKHEFVVWHERSGYVPAGTKHGFEVTVEPDKTTDLGVIQVPLDEFPE